MIILVDGPRLRELVARACRVLADRGLVEGVLGHVSARVGEGEMVVRCRGAEERGLAASTAQDIWRMTLDGTPVDLPEGYAPPKELPLHGELLRARPDVGAVVHAHPRSALLCGLAGLKPRAVFGAYDIPAMRLARDGLPVYDRSVLVAKRELAREVVHAMGESDVCLLRGHGVVVSGRSVEEAVVRAVALDTLLTVTVELALLGARPEVVPDEDLSELPDLGAAFNSLLSWRTLVRDLEG